MAIHRKARRVALRVDVLTRARRRLPTFALPLTLVVSCGARNIHGSDSDGCETDFDCKGERVCIAGACQNLSRVGGGGQANLGGFGAGASSGGTALSSGGAFSSGGAPLNMGGFTTAFGGSTGVGSSGSGSIVLQAPKEVAVEAKALVADPLRGKLYAVVSSSASRYANELVVIDAARGVVDTSVAVGSDPDTLAISDDGSRLWVGLSGALSIREVDLTVSPPLPGSQFALPPSRSFGNATRAGKIVVLPGTPQSVVATLLFASGNSIAGVAAFDDGVPRSTSLNDYPMPYQLTGGPPGFLFGFNDHDTGFEFVTLAIDAMGVRATRRSGLIEGFETTIAYDAGLVLASSGHVMTVADPTAPARAGKFAFVGLVIPHVAESMAVMLSSVAVSQTFDSDNRLVLRRLNIGTFREDFEASLPGKYGDVRDFVEPIRGTFAFLAPAIGDFDFGTPRTTYVNIFKAPKFAQ
ncbi:MAG TPA: hypothetical protein VFQ35_02070 [Polyangiaceae bacterium]|nr:hypothetical protein [Polyangiaceae bacterium]